ncbi:MAG: endonuclease/exonuclease/phosphatase family protein, partial [Clostridia bacterium]|nr:endonuclease/exonuclease/phosphatase family protein [Clostridia bacterium]
MKEKNSFVAATFNLRRDCYCDGKRRWKHRRDAVISVIRNIGADVLGVQELTPKMKKDIEAHLPEYLFVGRPRCGGVLSEHNDILVKRDKFSVESEETFWLSDKPQKPGSRMFGAFYPRICTNVRLKSVNGDCINVLNTHYDHRSLRAREFASRLIKDTLDGAGKVLPT